MQDWWGRAAAASRSASPRSRRSGGTCAARSRWRTRAPTPRSADSQFYILLTRAPGARREVHRVRQGDQRDGGRRQRSSCRDVLKKAYRKRVGGSSFTIPFRSGYRSTNSGGYSPGAVLTEIVLQDRGVRDRLRGEVIVRVEIRLLRPSRDAVSPPRRTASARPPSTGSCSDPRTSRASTTGRRCGRAAAGSRTSGRSAAGSAESTT